MPGIRRLLVKACGRSESASGGEQGADRNDDAPGVDLTILDWNEHSGAAIRIRSAGFPTRKSLEDFNFDHQPALNRSTIAHLGTGAFLTKARNVVLLGPPGTGKTHLAVGLAIKAAQSGRRVAFSTAVDWVARLKAAHNAGRQTAELTKLRRTGLLVAPARHRRWFSSLRS
jgi:DNA replication protein DnaC